MTLLQASGIFAGYGGVDIVQGAGVAVAAREIAVIIGPNGAGKSTLMKALFGLVAVREGEVRFDDKPITHLPPHHIAQAGMAYVPQERNIFASLTVEENLEIGAYTRRDDFRPQLARIYELFPPLAEKRRQAAGTLSGGQRQMVAIGRAMMLAPRLLLMDEPTAGLSPLFIELIFEKIQQINQLGVAILMVEQNAKQALTFADQGFVLAMGRNRHSDSGPGLLADPEIADMFLGG